MFGIKKKKMTNCVIIMLLLAISVALTGCENNENSQNSKSHGNSSQSSMLIEVFKKEARRTIDFEELHKENSDVFAWIEVPGTVIDYPIMYSGDNEFYLTHNEKKEKDKNGAVFMDMGNVLEFTDPVIVTYGHYTLQDTFYSQLHLYKDKEYFDANRDLYVYRPNLQLKYKIVAAFSSDDKNILYGKNYQTPKDMQNFISWVNEIESPDANINMAGCDASDYYIVLSTCLQAEFRDNYRYIVIAKLIEEI